MCVTLDVLQTPIFVIEDSPAFVCVCPHSKLQNFDKTETNGRTMVDTVLAYQIQICWPVWLGWNSRSQSVRR